MFLAPLDEFEHKQMLAVAGFANLCLEPLQIEQRRMMNGSWDENSSILPQNAGATPCSTPGKNHLASSSMPTGLKPKIPRPANEWILYRADNHLPIKKAYPGITNNEICKFSHLLRTLLQPSNYFHSFNYCWNVGCRNSRAAPEVQDPCRFVEGSSQEGLPNLQIRP